MLLATTRLPHAIHVLVCDGDEITIPERLLHRPDRIFASRDYKGEIFFNELSNLSALSFIKENKYRIPNATMLKLFMEKPK